MHQNKHTYFSFWHVCCMRVTKLYSIWAATWQNQQSDYAPSEDSDQPGHPPSLFRVIVVRLMGSKGSKLSSCGQRRLWSDWADAQADLSLRWAHTHFVGFVMSRLICVKVIYFRFHLLHQISMFFVLYFYWQFSAFLIVSSWWFLFTVDCNDCFCSKWTQLL